MKEYKVIGLMSGTSLDGLDIAVSTFSEDAGKWTFHIDESHTQTYSLEWKRKLVDAPALSGEQLIQLDREYGIELGRMIVEHVDLDAHKPLLVSSHGHTVFHDPVNGYTCQIGSGVSLAVTIGLPVVCDLRSLDVAYGGQGAPLVPVGDELLFSNFDACLNLGGFSNISFNREGERKAFDICPVNIGLNYLAAFCGVDYDKHGALGRNGEVIPEVLELLNNLTYYRERPPKSLSREWLEREVLPLLDGTVNKVENLLATFYEHIAQQVAIVADAYSLEDVYITGGGALNAYLVEKLRDTLKCKVIVPDKSIVEFKEALIFGFLGLLRYLGRVNCFASVTGAQRNSVSGILVHP